MSWFLGKFISIHLPYQSSSMTWTLWDFFPTEEITKRNDVHVSSNIETRINHLQDVAPRKKCLGGRDPEIKS